MRSYLHSFGAEKNEMISVFLCFYFFLNHFAVIIHDITTDCSFLFDFLLVLK
jgi:hypothetical protein